MRDVRALTARRAKRPAISLTTALLVSGTLACSSSTCGGNYPRQAPGAELQQNSLSMRISNDTLQFVRNNLSAVLAAKFGMDADGYTTIFLPEAPDASANTLCDEDGHLVGYAACTYGFRIRDGCQGPGVQDTSGSCGDPAGRETMRSYIRVKIADLAQHISFEMEPSGSGAIDQGGIRLRIDNLAIDFAIGVYARLPSSFLGITLGTFACSLQAAPGKTSAIVINHLDVSLEPRVVQGSDGKAGLFATTFAHTIDFGELNLRALEISPQDPACVTANCAASCASIDKLLSSVDSAFSTVQTVLTPVLPYIVTPLGNLLLALLWGDDVQFSAGVPTATLPWVPKGVGRDVALLAGAQNGAFDVTQVGGGSGDPSMGMRLPFAMGAYAEMSPCVGPVTPPPSNTQELPPLLDGLVGITDPTTGEHYDEPYHLGVLLSQSYLNSAAFALRNSGILCAEVGSNPDGLLTTGDFVPTVGLLSLLAPPLTKLAPQTSPIFFRTTPGRAPNLRLGSGKAIGVDANGKVVKESVLTLDLFDSTVEFNVFAWNRSIRAFALQVDIEIGLSVYPTQNGKLTFTIDTIAANNVRQMFNALDIENYAFTHLSEVIFAILSSQLGGGRLTFDVPVQETLKQALSGAASARVLDVRAEGPAKDYLAAYVKLCSAADDQDPLNKGCFLAGPAPGRDTMPAFSAHQVQSAAALAEMYLPLDASASNLGDLQALRARGVPTGRVLLAIDDASAALGMGTTTGVEYQAAVDSDVYGRFSSPADDGLLRVEHPALHMLGKHVVRLRARTRGGRIDLAAPIATVNVIVDPEKPLVIVEDHAGKRVLDSADLVTAKDAMSFQVAAHGSDLTRAAWLLHDDAEALLNTLPANALVVAKDEAGNLSTDLPFFAKPAAAPVVVAPRHAGCSATGEPVGQVVPSALLTLALGALLFRRRRRATH